MSDFSKRLFDAGKTKAVVIGHATSTNPGSDPKKQDYRQGTRIVYHNGTELFRTEKKGRITAREINRALNLKIEKQNESKK